jgi:hypothetical protein
MRDYIMFLSLFLYVVSHPLFAIFHNYAFPLSLRALLLMLVTLFTDVS